MSDIAYYEYMQHSLEEIFTRVLPRHNAQFEVREGQQQLSHAIDHAMQKGEVFAAEAGTGTGKSFAYLVPALLQAAQGQQVVVVTASIALQHQLADNDIPYLQKVLGLDLPVTVLKGKSNYLCSSRLRAFLQGQESLLFDESDDLQRLREHVLKWASVTQSGDRECFADEMAGETQERVYMPQSLWQHMCTHEFACGGVSCAVKGFRGCFFQSARRRVFQAGIIVTNYNVLSYHLLHMLQTQEAASSEGGRMGDDETPKGEGLLPSAAIFVLDEAHRIKTILRDSMALSFSKSTMQNMYDVLFGRGGSVLAERAAGKAFSPAFETKLEGCQKSMQEVMVNLTRIDEVMQPVFSAHVSSAEEALSAHEATRNQGLQAGSIRYEDCANDALLDLFFALSKDLERIALTLQELAELCNEKGALSMHLGKSAAWCSERAQLCNAFSAAENVENIVKFVSYSQTKKECSYSSIPLSVRGFLSRTLFEDAHAVVALSATLTAQKQFHFWARQVGFPREGKTMLVASPFDYASRVQLLVPKDAPEPNDRAYTQYLAHALPPLFDTSRGRALVLCTSKAMVAELSQALRSHAEEHASPWQLCAQDGVVSAAALFSTFRETQNAVLVATATFWEGFDAPDDLLRLLVITRIPFASPEDLLFKEEKRYVEREGKNWFAQLALPLAEIKLRQGFGRLMRGSSDGGTVLITDKRMISKGYGNTLLSQLPQCAYAVAETQDMALHIQSHLQKFNWH